MTPADYLKFRVEHYLERAQLCSQLEIYDLALINVQSAHEALEAFEASGGPQFDAQVMRWCLQRALTVARRGMLSLYLDQWRRVFAMCGAGIVPRAGV